MHIWDGVSARVEERSADERAHVVEATLPTLFTERNTDRCARRECAQGAIWTVVFGSHVVYGMAAVSLDLHDIPELAVCAREDADVGGLAPL